ncbi:hypothetical protein HNS38_03850 [Lentimicrobium sp. L6]|uniref:toxin-antitoxin system YwqK family antitoxin n=1 Tax=Lentimicrobium sp. L6 TaxID=2735916 RepID=UPI001556899E|nr:hypothetical protein [Lentimicrobium sp. L6]NPD83876.1 hypothetical protein [Lentimicrobium sp. L6]
MKKFFVSFSFHDFLLILLWVFFSINVLNSIKYLTNYDFIPHLVTIIVLFFNSILTVPLFLARKSKSRVLTKNVLFILIYSIVFVLVFWLQIKFIYQNRVIDFILLSIFLKALVVVSIVLVVFTGGAFYISLLFRDKYDKLQFKGFTIQILLIINIVFNMLFMMIEGDLLRKEEKVYWEENRILNADYYKGFPNYFTSSVGLISGNFEYDILSENFDSIRVKALMLPWHSYLKDGKYDDETLIHFDYYFKMNELFSRKFKEALVKLPPEFISEENIYLLYLQYYKDYQKFMKDYYKDISYNPSLKNVIKNENKIDSLLNLYKCYAPSVIVLNTLDRVRRQKDFDEYQETVPINKLQTDYYKNGNKKYEVFMIDGKLEGWYKIWYESGELDSEIEYHNGMRNGLMLEYYKNGQISARMLYDNGNCINDSTINWYDNGQVKSRFLNGEFEYYDRMSQVELD